MSLTSSLSRLFPKNKLSTTFSFNLNNRFNSDSKAARNVSDEERYIPKEDVERFIIDCMKAVGTPDNRSRMLAANLTEADYRGHFSHGLNRLSMYVQDIKSGMCDPNATPTVLKEGVSTAWIDGNNGLGVVTGTFGMELAIKKAKENGVGWVAAKGSNHFGICQWYTDMSLKEGLIGISSTNTSPLVTPCRAKKPMFGTNPISISAPGIDNDKFTFDMSTSSVAVGKIEIQMRRGEKLPSTSWALGSNGLPTTDAREAFYNGSGLMPLGGPEINSGYKGYGLAMTVELLCGIMSGASYGPNIRKWMNNDKPANLGQCFIAVDPECFAPGLSVRMQDLIDYLRALEPAEDDKPVLVPGDPEMKSIAEVNEKGAIFYTPDHITSYEKLANELNVEPMKHM